MVCLNKKYVYLICDPAQELFKIGVTKNLYTKRMKQLQTGNGAELHLVKYHMTFFPYRMEKLLHAKFANKREHGEWFRLDINDISHFEQYCSEFEELIESLKENPFLPKNYVDFLFSRI